MKICPEVERTKPSGGLVHARSILLLGAVITVAAFAVACGSDSPAGPGEPDAAGASDSGTNDFGFEISLVANAGSVYSVEDVESAGWKRSRELPADLLEGVSEVWFGFYQQKNLEVRVYASHDEAKRLGSASAEEVVARSRGVSVGAAGPYMKQTTQYAGYGVVGNLVVLCEFEVGVCADLAAALEQ